MDIASALETLGVADSTLTEGEKSFLDLHGYLVLEGVLSHVQIERLRARLDDLLQEEGDAAGLEVHQEPGTERLSDLVNKGEVFEVCFTHPRVLAGIAHVLHGDLKLSSLNARFAKPGEGRQALHADWGRLEREGEFQVCNSIWLLDDFTAENGATRVVPGSHLWGTRLPSDDMVDPSAPHPEEKLLLGRAGTVVIFNSHTWHGGTLNRTDKRRRALHSYFCRRHHPQQLDQQRFLRSETRERLSDAARTILDVH